MFAEVLASTIILLVSLFFAGAAVAGATVRPQWRIERDLGNDGYAAD